jgi:hypothetical protein
MAYRGKVKALRVGPRRLLLSELAVEADKYLGFEMVEVIARHRLRRSDRNRVAAAYFEHAAAHGDMMFSTAIVAPTCHRHDKRRQEIGMTGQNTERTGFVLCPHMRDIVGLDNDRQRRGDGKPHGTLART